MIIFVVGKQNSGKSRFAEELAAGSGTDRRYYIATMKICDEAGRERVIRHRKQRDGKGFITIELQYGINRAVQRMEEPKNSVVLLECVANLVGNEMYDNSERAWAKVKKEERYTAIDEDEVTETVMKDIMLLADNVKELVIVSDEYDADGVQDEETRKYIGLIGLMNERLAEYADDVYRV